MANLKKNALKRGKIDITFFSLVLILLTIGLVMLFSASYAYSYEYYGNSYKFISRQALFAVAGVIVMLWVSRWDYHFFKRFAWVIYLGVNAILLSVPPNNSTNSSLTILTTCCPGVRDFKTSCPKALS